MLKTKRQYFLSKTILIVFFLSLCQASFAEQKENVATLSGVVGDLQRLGVSSLFQETYFQVMQNTGLKVNNADWLELPRMSVYDFTQDDFIDAHYQAYYYEGVGVCFHRLPGWFSVNRLKDLSFCLVFDDESIDLSHLED